jgi:GntR family galactonate operon transcriptional repressor
VLTISSLSLQRPSIKRQRLHDQITRYLAIEILSGKLRNGVAGFSSETELSAYLRVSRTALRESIKVLAAKGLLDVRPKVGIRIRPREEWNLLDPDLLAWQGEAGVDDLFIRNLCEVRLIVETAACELAAIRGSEQDFAQIKKAYLEAEAVAHDSVAYGEADMNFHNAIFTACHNELLKQMSNTIGKALRNVQRLTRHLSPSVGLPLHKAVADAICKADSRAARRAMRRLAVASAETLYGVLHPNQPRGWETLRFEIADRASARTTRTEKRAKSRNPAS